MCAAVSILGACGGAEPTQVAPVPSAARAASPLPAVDVHDIASGDLVPLQNLLPAAKPLLVWFWAPH